MVVLRPTRKLRSLLPATDVVPRGFDTALGDWYVNRLTADRKPLLLLVSSTSLLPMLVPAWDVRGLPKRLVALKIARAIGPIDFDPDGRCDPFDVVKHLTGSHAKKKLGL